MAPAGAQPRCPCRPPGFESRSEDGRERLEGHQPRTNLRAAREW